MSPALPGMFFTTEPPGQDTEKLSMTILFIFFFFIDWEFKALRSNSSLLYRLNHLQNYKRGL